MNRCTETLFDEASQSEGSERTCLANEKAGRVMCSSAPSGGIATVRRSEGVKCYIRGHFFLLLGICRAPA